MGGVNRLPYRHGVGIALFNRDGMVFVGERIDTPGAWQMPQGGIDEGEDIQAAFFRELAEETGTGKAKIIRVMDHPLFYDLPPALQKKLWGGRFRGQQQTWIAARFTGTDSEINIAAYQPAEFCRWQWVALERTIELIVPFKHEIYSAVISAFRDIPAQLTG